MKKDYKFLIFDADHTLLDYGKDEKSALWRTFKGIGVPPSEELVSRAHALSEIVGTEHGLYDVENPEIQKNYHRLYRSHVKEIFKRLFDEFAVTADERLAGERFLQELTVGGAPINGAMETLFTLSEKTGGKYKIYIATNGVSDIQRGRLMDYERYYEELFISEEVGAIKPTEAFFDKILTAIGANKTECLMIGDSLTSDIKGAALCGIDACWFNPSGKINGVGANPSYAIRALTELKEIL